MPSDSIHAINAVRQAKSMQLSISDELSRGRYWNSHYLPHPVTLGRVEHLPREKLPRQVPNLDVADITLRLTKRLGTIRFRDFYYARLESSSAQTDPVVVSLVDLSAYIAGGDGDQAYMEMFVSNDFDIYKELESLQGSVIPIFGGLFSRDTLLCTVYQDAGRFITREERQNPAIKDRIVRAVKALHAEGVDATLYDWKHLCIDDQGEIKFTDTTGWVSPTEYLEDATQNLEQTPGSTLQAEVDKLLAPNLHHALAKTYETLR